MNLEETLHEFLHSGKMSALERQQLDKQLTHFKQQPESLDVAQQFLTTTTGNQDLIWFCLSVYEESIQRHYFNFAGDKRESIKQTMISLLFSPMAGSGGGRIAMKLVKNIIEIAKRSWPHDFPELLTLIQRCIFDRLQRLTGLRLLCTMVQEFTMNARRDISSARRSELKGLLMQQVPAILVLLKQVLDDSYDPRVLDHSRSLSASPTGSFFPQQSQPPPTPHFASFQAPTRGIIDSDTRQICNVALETILSLFSCIPVDNVVSLQLMDTILKFSQLNDAADVELGILATSALIELISKKFVMSPDYLMLCYHYSLNVLKYLTSDVSSDFIVGGSSDGGAGGVLDDLDEDYRMKLTEFVTVLLANHISKIEQLPSDVASLDYFLQIFYRYTIAQPNVFAYRECLITWSNFMDHLALNAAPVKYRNVILVFMKEVLRRVQYTQNPSELSDIEDDMENCLGQTDYDVYLDEVLELVAKSVEFYPAEVISLVFSQFSSTAEKLEPLLKAKCEALSDVAYKLYVFKDMKASLRMLGRLSDFLCRLYGGGGGATTAGTREMMELFLRVDGACMDSFSLHYQDEHFLNMFVECYASFLAFVPWLKLHSADPAASGSFDELCSKITNKCILAIRSDVPSALSAIASRLLYSIVQNVRPARLLEYEGMAGFLGGIHGTSATLPTETKKHVYMMASFVCLTYFPTSNGYPEYQNFVGTLTNSFISLSRHPEFIAAGRHRNLDDRAKIQHVISGTCALLGCIQSEKNEVRLLLYNAIKDALPFVLELFKAYSSSSGTSAAAAAGAGEDVEMMICILDFFRTLLAGLKKQMGLELVSYIILGFISVFQRETISKVLGRDDKSAELLQGMTDIIRVIMEDNSKVFDGLVPTLVQFMNDCFSPALLSSSTETSETVRPGYLSLLQYTLVHNWKFFFPASGLVRKQTLSAEEEAQRVAMFNGVFGGLMSPLSQTNMEAVRQCVAAIGDVHSKTRLFQEVHFKVNIEVALLGALIQAVVDGVHDSSREEIFGLVYAIASCDFPLFYDTFLMNFLTKRGDVPDESKYVLHRGFTRVEDSPTFIDNLNKFCDDLVCFQKQ